MLLLAETTAHSMLMTIVVAIATGAMLIVISRRYNVPAIVLLLFGGVALGPAFCEGILGVPAPVDPREFGDGLPVIVSLSVGLILFEGGLTLDITGYREAPAMIKRLLTIGVVITWFGTALIIRLLFDQPWDVAIIGGSLVIVTGPTVIAPLLKRVKVTAKLHSILHWEGVLIDPIGVFIALLCFEWISEESGQAAILNLFIRVAWGLSVGIAGGWLLATFVRRKMVPEEIINVFALGFAVLVFGVAEMVRSEAGLMAVTAAGFVFGLTSTSKLRQVKQFKAEITDLLIGTLFILLAARLSFDQFRDFGIRGVLAVAAVMLIIRPLSIYLCSIGAGLSLREKVFLSWISPRGIVAASMASLVAISMSRMNTPENTRFPQPRFIETFTYSVIVATVVLQGSSAGMAARLLRLKRTLPTGWMVVGAHAFGRRVAEFFARAAERQVLLVDSNPRAVRDAQGEGLASVVADARDTALADRQEFQGVGNVLALTDNEDLNVRICQNWRALVGRDHVYRCNPADVDVLGKEDGEDEEGTFGRVVWSRLPKPSLLAAELQRGEATLVREGAADANTAEPGRALLLASDGSIVFDPDDDDLKAAGEGRRVLCLFRRADYLLRALRPDLITTLEVQDLRSLLEMLVERMVGLYPTLPRQATVDELLERESAFPTVLGHGVAVPHAYSKELDGRLCAVAQVPGGLNFSGREGDEPVRLVFLLLSPQGDPEGHLATLAEIARLVIHADVRERLMTATSPLEVIRIVREAREQ